MVRYTLASLAALDDLKSPMDRALGRILHNTCLQPLRDFHAWAPFRYPNSPAPRTVVPLLWVLPNRTGGESGPVCTGWCRGYIHPYTTYPNVGSGQGLNQHRVCLTSSRVKVHVNCNCASMKLPQPRIQLLSCLPWAAPMKRHAD